MKKLVAESLIKFININESDDEEIRRISAFKTKITALNAQMIEFLQKKIASYFYEVELKTDHKSIFINAYIEKNIPTLQTFGPTRTQFVFSIQYNPDLDTLTVYHKGKEFKKDHFKSLFNKYDFEERQDVQIIQHIIKELYPQSKYSRGDLSDILY